MVPLKKKTMRENGLICGRMLHLFHWLHFCPILFMESCCLSCVRIFCSSGLKLASRVFSSPEAKNEIGNRYCKDAVSVVLSISMQARHGRHLRLLTLLLPVIFQMSIIIRKAHGIIILNYVIQ